MAKYNNMSVVLQAAKALSDPNRVRALLAMRNQELCVCQITELLQLAPSTVSKHLSILKQAGLVESRKVGRWIYYRLIRPRRGDVAGELLLWSMRHLAEDADIEADARRLDHVLCIDPEALCRKQMKN